MKSSANPAAKPAPPRAERRGVWEQLEKFFDTRKVFICSDTLLTDGCDIFIRDIMPIIRKTGNKAIISQAGIDKIAQTSRSAGDTNLQRNASYVYEYLNALLMEQLIELSGDFYETRPFSSGYNPFPKLLITQNGFTGSVDDLIVKKVDVFGYLKDISSSDTVQLPINAITRAELKEIFKTNKIFIDTCSILEPACRGFFWADIAPIVIETGNKVIVSHRVLEELKSIADNPKKLDERVFAKPNLNYLKKLGEEQIIEVRGEESDNFADNVFLVVFTKHRINHNLVLVTQDNNLTAEILRLNESQAVSRAKTVSVIRFNKDGFLQHSKFREDFNREPAKTSAANYRSAKAENSVKREYQKPKPTPQRPAKPQVVEEEPPEEKFNLCKTITSVSETKIPVSNIPKEGDTILAMREGMEKEVKLLKALASGGEGWIFRTDTEYVAKVYKPEKIDVRKQEKLTLMLSRPISFKGLCWPQALLYNQDKQFVGYMMETASGIEIQRSLFIKPRLFEKFPNWKKRDTVQLCLTILEKIRYLHKKNIILGDINPANILIVSPTEVYFVDTDSYQVEDFPCPVGTVNYTAPELQGKNFGTFLRSFENEYFAVATLLFMIMLPGKSPYAQQGGEDPMENIRRMDFAYAYGENTTKMAPDGPWRFIWSNLPFSIKGAFYNTFRIDGENSAEDKRFTADEWHAKFKKYLEWIDSNLLPDEQQYVIFPDRLKKSDKVTYIKCVMCDREVAEDSCTDGICIECLKKGEVVKCAHCGKEFVYTNRQKLRKVKKSTLCPECNEKPYSTESCTVCGKRFTITVGESESYKSKGYSLPRRCPECRRNNAMPSQETSSVYSSETCSVCGTAFNITVRDYEYFTSKGLSLPRRCPECRRNKVTPSYVRRGLCFITTAVTDFMGKSDDCYELALLRNFRDSWLAYEADGEGLISEYYSIAPAIVRQLNASPNKEGVYRTLLRDYISPCVKYIEEGEFLTCKEHYIKMVKFLQRSFENGC